MRRLWAWLRGWFVQTTGFDIYRPADRLLYHYWDGQRVVDADPLTLYKRLMEKGPELSIDIKLALSMHPDAVKGHDAAVNKIHHVFRVKPVDEGGLTELESCALFDHFLLYCEELKKNSSLSPTSWPPPGRAASRPGSGVNGRPTQPSSDSGSTGGGPSTGPPELSPTEPASPSEDSPRTLNTTAP